jgi:hypothetical protein
VEGQESEGTMRSLLRPLREDKVDHTTCDDSCGAPASPSPVLRAAEAAWSSAMGTSVGRRAFRGLKRPLQLHNPAQQWCRCRMRSLVEEEGHKACRLRRTAVEGHSSFMRPFYNRHQASLWNAITPTVLCYPVGWLVWLWATRALAETAADYPSQFPAHSSPVPSQESPLLRSIGVLKHAVLVWSCIPHRTTPPAYTPSVHPLHNLRHPRRPSRHHRPRLESPEPHRRRVVASRQGRKIARDVAEQPISAGGIVDLHTTPTMPLRQKWTEKVRRGEGRADNVALGPGRLRG